MRQKPTVRPSSSEKVIKDIKRNTRKQYGAEEKIRIVMDGLCGEDGIAEPCRREDIASIEEQEVIDRLLEHLDRSTDAPHRAHPTRAPPQEQLPIRAGSGSRRAGRPDGRVGVGGGALRCRHAMVAVACRFRALDQAAECLSPSARTAQSW